MIRNLSNSPFFALIGFCSFILFSKPILTHGAVEIIDLPIEDKVAELKNLAEVLIG